MQLNVTVHHFTKTEKPISVNGKPWGKAVKVRDQFMIFCNGEPVATSNTVRGIEPMTKNYIRAQEAA